MSTALFFRLVTEQNKAGRLQSAVAEVTAGTPPAGTVFSAAPGAFSQIPGSPFAYWVSERIRRLFKELPPFESQGRTVRQGLATADDFRFLRLWWEVSPDRIVTGPGDGTREDFVRQTFEGKKWVPFAKGGAYSPYYADLHLVVNWEKDGEEIRAFKDPQTGRAHSRPQNTDFYFRPGLTWPLRAKAFCPQVLPEGTIFSVRGPAVLAPQEDLPVVLGVTGTKTFNFLFRILLGRFGFPEFVVGALKRVPFPARIPPDVSAEVRQLSLRAHAIQRNLDSGLETSRFFVLPHLLVGPPNPLSDGLRNWRSVESQLREEAQELQHRLDDISMVLYGLDSAEMAAESDEFAPGDHSHGPAKSAAEDRALTADVLSWLVGVLFGRFQPSPGGQTNRFCNTAGPFAPFPVASPGMSPDETDHGMPIEAHSDGLLAEDSGHPGKDIVRLVRELMERFWGLGAQDFEGDLSEALSVDALPDHFRNPGGFFEHHITRYSDSGRKAPIYWLLQSRRRSYSLWLYYHRITGDTLWKVLSDYVEPKIEHERRRLGELESKVAKAQAAGSGPQEREVGREIERQKAILEELAQFRADIREVAEMGYQPDRDDGVIINIAPLHKLVPWTEAAAMWKELLEGKYPWSTMSTRIREWRAKSK